MSQQDVNEIKKQITKAVKSGARIFYYENGKSYGPECDCCGKTGIDLLSVMELNEGEDPWNDTAQYVFANFGKTCFKNSGIEALPLTEENVANAWKAPKKTLRQKQLKDIRAGYGKKKKNRKMIAGRYVETFMDFLESTLIPDLKESGSVYTAKDFETAVKWIKHYKELSGE